MKSLKRATAGSIIAAILAVAGLTCDEDKMEARLVGVPTLAAVVVSADTASAYAKRDSLHKQQNAPDYDSLNALLGELKARRQPVTNANKALTIVARIRGRDDVLLTQPFVPQDSTPTDTTKPPVDTQPPPPQPQPPPAFCGVTDLNSRPTSPLAKPPYLVPVKDPDLGGQIVRITGDPGSAIGGGVSGTWPAISAHHYSKDQPWSADMRLIFLSRFSPSLTAGQYLFLDAGTLRPVFARNVPGPEARWAPTKPDTMIYVTSSGGVGYWDVRKNTWSVRVPASGYSSASLGNNEGSPSYDGRYVAVLATSSAGKKVAYVVDLLSNTKGADIDLTASGASSVDWVSMSASGLYVVAAVNDRQTYVWNRSTGAIVQKITNYLFGHADLALNESGADVIWGGVGGGPSASLKTFAAITLSGGSVYLSTPPTTYNVHASGKAYKRPGWGYGVVNTTDGGLGGELFAAALSGPMRVERYAHHRSSVTSGSAGFNYNSEPHAVPSPDGKQYMFASNWGSTSVVSAFIVSCP